MANSITHSKPVAVYGALHTLMIEFRKSDGTTLSPTSLDSEISKDGGTFADCTNEVTLIEEVGGSDDSAYGFLTLTAAEMTADDVTVQIKSANCVTIGVNLRPERLMVVQDASAQAGANDSITLNAGDSAEDNIYTGMSVRIWANTGAGQVRHITQYEGATRIATVAPNWETNPAVGSSYYIGFLADNAVNAVRLDAAMTSRAAATLLTTALTESYAADGAAATPAQLLHMIWSLLAEKNVSGTTITAKKLDGSTTSMTFTINDATNPTAITRAS